MLGNVYKRIENGFENFGNRFEHVDTGLKNVNQRIDLLDKRDNPDLPDNNSAQDSEEEQPKKRYEVKHRPPKVNKLRVYIWS